ncbi:unnamed protein product [Rotaria sp. Silwood1]|nr:unnamed protein product [Rotaria sp. Silwood1]
MSNISSACLIRVSVEVIKQQAQINRNLCLSTIAQSCLHHEGLLDLYRGYFTILSREISFSVIQFLFWKLFKESWRSK